MHEFRSLSTLQPPPVHRSNHQTKHQHRAEVTGFSPHVPASMSHHHPNPLQDLNVKNCTIVSYHIPSVYDIPRSQTHDWQSSTKQVVKFQFKNIKNCRTTGQSSQAQTATARPNRGHLNPHVSISKSHEAMTASRPKSCKYNAATPSRIPSCLNLSSSDAGRKQIQYIYPGSSTKSPIPG
jgi:hypothetical protein